MLSAVSVSVRVVTPPVVSVRRLVPVYLAWPRPAFHSKRAPSARRCIHWPFRRASVNVPSLRLTLCS